MLHSHLVSSPVSWFLFIAIVSKSVMWLVLLEMIK